MNRKISILPYILFVIGIIILINIIAAKFYFRLDFTEDKRYTLSNTTKDLLDELDEPITVTAYFSEDLPPNIDATRRRFKELLYEFATRSKGNIVYEFINPNKDAKTEQNAVKNGISPVVINVRERDQSVQKKAFLGAVLRYGEKSEVIPFIQPGAGMEYALSSGIKKLTAERKNLVGFIQGHGEPTTTMMSQATEALEVINQIEGVNITDSTYLPKYKTLVLMAPDDSIPKKQLDMLDDYLAGGGNMVVAINRVDADLNQARGMGITTGIESWLEDKGIRVDDSFIIDANCGAVSVVQKQGIFSFSSQVEFPYLPIFNSFANHPVTNGLETIIMQFVSPLEFVGDSSLNFYPLVMSSEKSGREKVPLFFNIEKKWSDIDFKESNIVAAALVEGKITGENNAKLLVIGDGDFPVNGQGEKVKQINPDNVNLLVNSIDWLSDDTGLIELRTRGVTSRMLKQIDDGKKNFLKWMNVLLPVLIIIIYGLIRVQRNSITRERRRIEDYNR